MIMFLTRITKIWKIATPLSGYASQHHRVANSVAIFRILKIHVKLIR